MQETWIMQTSNPLDRRMGRRICVNVCMLYVHIYHLYTCFCTNIFYNAPSTVLTFVNLRDLHEFTQQIYRPHLRFTRGDLHLSLRFTRYRFTSFQKLRDLHCFETFEETRFTSIPKQEISMFSENESVLRRLALFDICKTSTCW